MALFKKKTNYLGVDFGTSSIKIVELADAGGEAQLVTYGFIEEKTSLIKSNSQETKERIVKSLKEVIRKSEAGADQVVAALPNYSVFSSIISLPTMSPKELGSAVRWEARKIVPMSIDDMVLDWKVIGEPAKPVAATAAPAVRSAAETIAKTKNVNILMTAAPKSLVARYIDIFKIAQLRLVSLETESFALTRAMIGRDMSGVMIVDIGAINTNIMIIVNNVPVLNRSIDVGGETITQRIGRSLNVDAERAEQFKRDFGMAIGEANNQVPKTIEFVIGSIINEIRYVVNLYQSQLLGSSSTKEIEKIILTGGSAFLPQLPEYLERVMKRKVIIGDPWARIAYPVDLKPVLDEVAPRLSVAAGLALREII